MSLGAYYLVCAYVELTPWGATKAGVNPSQQSEQSMSPASVGSTMHIVPSGKQLSWGLGLAVAKRVNRAMGIKKRVENRVISELQFLCLSLFVLKRGNVDYMLRSPFK